MKKLTLDLDKLDVESFVAAPELELGQGDAIFLLPSRRSCIEQCTTSCVP